MKARKVRMARWKASIFIHIRVQLLCYAFYKVPSKFIRHGYEILDKTLSLWNYYNAFCRTAEKIVDGKPDKIEEPSWSPNVLFAALQKNCNDAFCRTAEKMVEGKPDNAVMTPYARCTSIASIFSRIINVLLNVDIHLVWKLDIFNMN